MNDLARKELAFLYVADALEPDERDAIEERLRTGDVGLEAAIANATDAYSTVALALDPHHPNPELEAELLDRAEGRAAPSHESSASDSPSQESVRNVVFGRFPVRRVLAIAATIVLLLGGGVLARRLAVDAAQRADALSLALVEAERRAADLSARLEEARSDLSRTREELRESLEARLAVESRTDTLREELARSRSDEEELDATLEEVLALRDEVTRLESALAAALEATPTIPASGQRDEERLAALRDEVVASRRALELLRAPDVGIVDLFAVAENEPASASVFWDSGLRDCYLHANGLRPLEEGQHYSLWIEFEGGRFAHVSDFVADARGDAEFFAPLPQGDAPIRRTFVTIEAGASRARPSDAVVLRVVAQATEGPGGGSRRRYLRRRS